MGFHCNNDVNSYLIKEGFSRISYVQMFFFLSEKPFILKKPLTKIILLGIGNAGFIYREEKC